MQAYDFLWLYQHKNCKMQMGGSDQWGNITAGVELIRKRLRGDAFGLTCKLLTKADGAKFGKTEEGNVWLDPKRTSPYQFYQFWLNASDADAEKWIRIFTFLTLEEIENISNEHVKDPSKRILQKKLDEEITFFVHGKSGLEEALITTEKTFETKNIPAEDLSIEDIENMQGVMRSDYLKHKLDDGIDVVSFLAETNIFPSKGEARKTIQGGGVSINRKKIDNVQLVVDHSLLLHEKY